MQRSRREQRDELEGANTTRGEGEATQSNLDLNTANEKQYERALEGALEKEGVGEQLAMATAVGLGVAALEMELLPGVLLGVGAMLAPKMVPALSSILRPLAKTAIRLGYSAFNTAQNMVAEASEQVQDMVAEVKAEKRTERPAAAQQTGERSVSTPPSEGTPHGVG